MPVIESPVSLSRTGKDCWGWGPHMVPRVEAMIAELEALSSSKLRSRQTLATYPVGLCDCRITLRSSTYGCLTSSGKYTTICK